jgi:D-alanine-D-alanine ligase
MLLEELIDGQEITVAVLADKVLPVIEIIPPQDAEFDYENKYNGKTQELCPPQHISEDIQKQAQELALRIHKELGLRDFSRTDIMIRRSDSKLFVLETNTIPGLTDQSLLPKAAAVGGINMPTFVKMLVEAARARV